MPPQPRSSAGDALPQPCQVIEVRVSELRQLFNAIDPSPFRQRDLDPRAEEFIVDWASDLPMDKPWALVVHLDRPRDESTKLLPSETRFTSTSVSESSLPGEHFASCFVVVVSVSSSRWHFSPRRSRLGMPSPATSRRAASAKSFAKAF